MSFEQLYRDEEPIRMLPSSIAVLCVKPLGHVSNTLPLSHTVRQKQSCWSFLEFLMHAVFIQVPCKKKSCILLTVSRRLRTSMSLLDARTSGLAVRRVDRQTFAS